MDPLYKIVAFIGIALILLKIPIIGKYVAVVNTLVHEVGHATMSVLTGGSVEKIELFANTEGTAWSSNRFWLGRVLTSLAGYPAASGTALVYLCLIKHELYLYVLISLVFILIVSFIFWIRNIYGFFWVISLMLLFGVLIFYGNDVVIENVLLLITSIIFVESILSAFTIFMLSFSQPTNAGDATNLWKSVIFIPSPIWGSFFLAQSLVLGYIGLKIFIS